MGTYIVTVDLFWYSSVVYSESYVVYNVSHACPHDFRMYPLVFRWLATVIPLGFRTHFLDGFQ